MLSESAGDGRKAVPDVGWIDCDSRVRLDLFSQRGDSDREIEELLSQPLNSDRVARVAERELGEQVDRVVIV